MTVCQLKSIDKIYGEGSTQVFALKGVDFTLEAGEFAALCGPSGSGKTTMLNLIGCLDVPSAGEIHFENTALSTLTAKQIAHLRAKRIGFVFQSFNLIPVLTAVENVELALLLSKTSMDDRRERSLASLETVGLADLSHRKPNELSGGQQQRVAIARALVKQPALIIADEPTANLDSKTGAQVLDLMRAMNTDANITFLFSTHDKMVMDYASRLITLQDGTITKDQRSAASNEA